MSFRSWTARAASGEPLITGPWSDEEVAYLQAHYRDQPAHDIAYFLDRTRNAVIGKANRIGLSEPKASLL